MLTQDIIFIIKQVIGKANEYKYLLVNILLDFKKVSDTIYKDATVDTI